MAALLDLTQQEEERAREIHHKAIILDCHSDVGGHIFRRRMRGAISVLEQKIRGQLKTGNVTGSLNALISDSECLTYGGPGAAAVNGLRAIEFAKQEIESANGWVIHATHAEDFRRAKRENKVAFAFHFEGGMPIGSDLALVRVFKEMGLSSMGLTWNMRNQIADGIGDRSVSGLSNFGAELIPELNRRRILIDVSHLSDKGFWDVLGLSNMPVIASHSNARTLCDHPRNLSDEQIQALAEKGGTIGMVFYSPFIDTERPSLERLLDHVEHIVRLVGVEHIAIGPDFTDYFVDDLPANLPRDTLPTQDPSTTKYPDEIADTSKLVNFTRGLVSRGYSDNEMFKILGENVLMVLQRVWGS